MEEEIKIGDLVYVARTCCSGTQAESLGLLGQVTEIYPKVRTICEHCRTVREYTITNFNRGIFCCAPTAWLRKIPPLADSTEVPTKAELVV